MAVVPRSSCPITSRPKDITSHRPWRREYVGVDVSHTYIRKNIPCEKRSATPVHMSARRRPCTCTQRRKRGRIVHGVKRTAKPRVRVHRHRWSWVWRFLWSTVPSLEWLGGILYKYRTVDRSSALIYVAIAYYRMKGRANCWDHHVGG